jgi:hypothetical protein
MIKKKRKKKRLHNLNISEISLTKSPASGIFFSFVKHQQDDDIEVDACEFGEMLAEAILSALKAN